MTERESDDLDAQMAAIGWTRDEHEAEWPTDPANPKSPKFAGPCPRCGKGVPNDEHRGEYPGALSRVDNETFICSQCGQDEGMFQFMSGNIKDATGLVATARGRGPLPPLDQQIPSDYSIPSPPRGASPGMQMVWVEGHWRLIPKE